MATSDFRVDEEWELCNDNGFVCKRKKRRVVSDLQPPPLPPPDPDAEEKNRRERTKRTLVKLKDQFQKEIAHWEHLSNTLRAMEETTQQQQQKQRELQLREREQEQEQEGLSPSGSCLVKTRESVYGSLVDELVLKVEAQEAIIRNVSNLCDVAEAMCSAQEEHFKQSFFDLPIWDSPRQLISSLCDE